VAVELVTAGLGEDFDAAEAEVLELRGVGILVDANFANGVLGRHLATTEAIDIDGRGLRRVASGDGLKLLLEGGVIVGEGCELGSTEDESTLIIGGASACAGCDVDLLGFRGDDERGVEVRGGTGAGDNCGNKRGKTGEDDGDVVSARRKCEGVVSCGVRTGVGLGKFRRFVGLNVDDSTGDDGT